MGPGRYMVSQLCWLVAMIVAGPAESPDATRTPASVEVPPPNHREADLTMRIEEAIRMYQAAPMPDKHELAGLNVLIHVDEGGKAAAFQEPEASPGQEAMLGLMTAAWLVQMIEKAGGRAVLTRPDGLALRMREASEPAELARRCREAGADVLLIIDDRPAGASSANAPSLSEQWNTWGDPEAPQGLTLPGVNIPAGRVTVTATLSPGIQLPPHVIRAAEIYRELATFAAASAERIIQAQARRERTDGSGKRRPGFTRREDQQRHKLTELARTIWPEGPLPTQRAAWFAGLFRQVALSDHTGLYYEPRIACDGRTVVIEGATSVPVLRETLVLALRAVGIEDIRNRIRLLPDLSRLGGQRFGACRVTSALTFREPDESSPRQTQLLYGEAVYLLDSEPGFLLVQASDGYWGWTRTEAVQPMDEASFRKYINGPHAVLTASLRVGHTWIPRGARLPISARSADRFTLTGPGGESLAVDAALVEVLDLRERLERRVERGLDMLHTPYVFAGRSPWGVDCSGFITNVCEDEGTPIARDAAQQFLSGKLVATPWFRDNIQAGDRLYFIDLTGKIFHTGLALSGTHFLHASGPGVKINALMPSDPLYDPEWAAHLLAAKRP